MGKKKKMLKAIKKDEDFLHKIDTPERYMTSESQHDRVIKIEDFESSYPLEYKALGDGLDVNVGDHHTKAIARLAPSTMKPFWVNQCNLVFTDENGNYLQSQVKIPIFVFDWESSTVTLRYGYKSLAATIKGRVHHYNPYMGYSPRLLSIVKEYAFDCFNSGDQILEEIFCSGEQELTVLDIIEARVICILVDSSTGECVHLSFVDGVDISKSSTIDNEVEMTITGCIPIDGIWMLSTLPDIFDFYTSSRESVMYSRRAQIKSALERDRKFGFKPGGEIDNENQG